MGTMLRRTKKEDGAWGTEIRKPHFWNLLGRKEDTEKTEGDSGALLTLPHKKPLVAMSLLTLPKKSLRAGRLPGLGQDRHSLDREAGGRTEPSSTPLPLL